MIQFIKIREHNIKFAQNINLRKLSYLKARYPAIWEIIEKYRMDRKEIYTRVYTSAKDEGYLNEAYNLCKENNVLFIADEVQTGLGRTGKMLCSDYANIKPDILILLFACLPSSSLLMAFISTIIIFFS